MAKLKNLPPQKQIEADTIQVLNSLGGKARRKEAINALAKKWQLTQEELGYHTPGGWVYYEHRIDGVAHKLRSEGRIVTDNDGLWQLLEGKPGKLPIVSSLPPIPKRHDELKQKMIDIGKRLEYYTTTEESLGQYRPDVLWKPGTYMRDPCHVIEICAGGSLSKDFDSLNWSREKLRARGILVTVDESDYHKAEQRFSNQSNIVVAKADTIDRLHELIDSDLELLKSLFDERPK